MTEIQRAGFTIGRDLGPFGTIFRVVSGAVAVWFGGAEPVQDPAQAPATAGFLLAVAALYLLIHRLYRLLPITSRDPFVATVVALAPLGVLRSSIFPAALHSAVGLYIGASLRLRGLNPLLAALSTPTCAPVLVGTRLRGGTANSARGAASFLAEAITTSRAAGATGLLVARVDSAWPSPQ